MRSAFQADGEGKWQMGNVLAFWFGLLALAPPIAFFFRLGPEIGFWEMITGSFLLGVVAVGFKHELAVTAFKGFAKAIESRIKGS